MALRCRVALNRRNVHANTIAVTRVVHTAIDLFTSTSEAILWTRLSGIPYFARLLSVMFRSKASKHVVPEPDVQIVHMVTWVISLNTKRLDRRHKN